MIYVICWETVSLQELFSRRENEVFVFVDLGGAVWFFLLVSYLHIFDAGRISSAALQPRRMDRDCAGNHRFSYQYQYGAFLSALYAQRD